MKKALVKVLATGFALAMVMSACSGSKEEAKTETPAMTEAAAPAAGETMTAPAMEEQAPAAEEAPAAETVPAAQ